MLKLLHASTPGDGKKSPLPAANCPGHRAACDPHHIPSSRNKTRNPSWWPHSLQTGRLVNHKAHKSTHTIAHRLPPLVRVGVDQVVVFSSEFALGSSGISTARGGQDTSLAGPPRLPGSRTPCVGASLREQKHIYSHTPWAPFWAQHVSSILQVLVPAVRNNQRDSSAPGWRICT